MRDTVTRLSFVVCRRPRQCQRTGNTSEWLLQTADAQSVFGDGMITRIRAIADAHIFCLTSTPVSHVLSSACPEGSALELQKPGALPNCVYVGHADMTTEA